MHSPCLGIWQEKWQQAQRAWEAEVHEAKATATACEQEVQRLESELRNAEEQRAVEASRSHARHRLSSVSRPWALSATQEDVLQSQLRAKEDSYQALLVRPSPQAHTRRWW
jgi:septal ring factor EnvC (AmiA/AmiB activator)